MKKLLYIIENMFFVFLLSCLCWMVYSLYAYEEVSFFDYHFMRIISNSMEPTLGVNTCIIIKEADEDELEVGDIITFSSKEIEIYGSYNTHRIYKIIVDEKTGEKRYVTKGDLFEMPDRLKLEYSDIIGKFQREVPFSNAISFLIEKLSNSKVYFIAIIFPLLLCLLSYIYQIIHLIVFGVEEDEEVEKKGKSLKKNILRSKKYKTKKNRSNKNKEIDMIDIENKKNKI